MIVSALCIGLAMISDETGDYDMANQFHDLDQSRFEAHHDLHACGNDENEDDDEQRTALALADRYAPINRWE